MEFHDPDHPLQQFLRRYEDEQRTDIEAKNADLTSRGYSPRHSFSHDSGGDTHPVLSLGQFGGFSGMKGKPARWYQEARSIPQKGKGGRTYQDVLNADPDNRHSLN